ncbi:hypothetical protein [Mangrovicella endophytica]|uniref:hypothetical protein n=1 Tax=Mangrovicella endophytica TaxID=2066697 RepID=UPI000C9E7F0A|nr:hypothetical protein [Mangrovicella endophytica]
MPGDAGEPAATPKPRPEGKNLPEVEASEALSTLAEALVREPDTEDFASKEVDLFNARPADQRGRWRSSQVISAVCEGYGMQAREADSRTLRMQWLDDPNYRQQLLAPEVSDLGFALQANGRGCKVAVAVLGTRR